MEAIHTGGMRDQNAVLRIKTKYVAASVIEQFAKGEIADAGTEGVPGQILVSNGGGLVLFKQGFLAAYAPYPDATTGTQLELGKDWKPALRGTRSDAQPISPDDRWDDSFERKCGPKPEPSQSDNSIDSRAHALSKSSCSTRSVRGSRSRPKPRRCDIRLPLHQRNLRQMNQVMRHLIRCMPCLVVVH